MTPIPNFIDTTYGYLYIPPVVYAFLYLTIESATLDAVVFTLPKWIYILFLLISLIGSSIVHRIFILLFGFEGSEKRPKQAEVIVKHGTGIMFGMNGQEISSRNLSEVLDHLGTRASVKDVVVAITLLVMVGGSAASLFLLPIPLSLVLLNGNPHPIFGSLLLVGLLLVILQVTVWDRFPSYVPPEEVERAHMPEYMFAHEKIEELSERDNVKGYE